MPALPTHLRSVDANNQRRPYAETTHHRLSTEQPPNIINIFNELKPIITNSFTVKSIGKNKFKSDLVYSLIAQA